MKAADIPDSDIFEIVDRIRATQGTWTLMSDLDERALPQFPYKVILAKMRQMINKKRIDGCGCGCKGDFQRIEQTLPPHRPDYAAEERIWANLREKWGVQQ